MASQTRSVWRALRISEQIGAIEDTGKILYSLGINIGLTLLLMSIICRSQKLRIRDTEKSRYFSITEFNNCFIIRSPSSFSYLRWLPIVLRSHARWGQKLKKSARAQRKKSVFFRRYFITSTWAQKAKLTMNFLAFPSVKFRETWHTGS